MYQGVWEEGFGKRLWFLSYLCHLLTSWHWPVYLTSLNLGFFIWNEDNISAYLIELLWGLNKIMYIKYLALCPWNTEQVTLANHYQCSKCFPGVGSCNPQSHPISWLHTPAYFVKIHWAAHLFVYFSVFGLQSIKFCLTTITTKALGVGIFITSILQMRKLRLQEVKSLVQDHRE